MDKMNFRFQIYFETISLNAPIFRFYIVHTHNYCYRLKQNRRNFDLDEMNSILEKWGDKNSSAMELLSKKSVWFSSFMTENDVKYLNQSDRLTSFSGMKCKEQRKILR